MIGGVATYLLPVAVCAVGVVLLAFALELAGVRLHELVVTRAGHFRRRALHGRVP